MVKEKHVPDCFRNAKIPTRIANILRSNGVSILADFKKYSETDLLRFDGLGHNSVNVIKDILAKIAQKRNLPDLKLRKDGAPCAASHISHRAIRLARENTKVQGVKVA